MRRRERPLSVAALLGTAIVSGALAGLVAACFIWLFGEGVSLVWETLPRQLGIRAFESWWLFAITVGGGVLVGLGQRFVGRYPSSIEDAVATWRAGGQLPFAALPRTFVNATLILVLGGPVGFEAALTGILGGAATGIGARIHAAGSLVRQAWGAERIESLRHPVRTLPYWLAALSGLVAYRALPFGQINLGFRFDRFAGGLDAGDALVALGFAALVAIPAAWALTVVRTAEHARLSDRSPVLVAMAGAAVFSLMAVGNDFVLFSGQQAIQSLPRLGTGALVYLMVAKWFVLVVALASGWRGGPIFPMYVSVASAAVLVAHGLGAAPDVVIVAGLASLGAVFLRGSVPVAFVLTLYVAPLSYAAVILIGAVGGAVALTLARSLGALPAPTETATATPEPMPSSR